MALGRTMKRWSQAMESLSPLERAVLEAIASQVPDYTQPFGVGRGYAAFSGRHHARCRRAEKW
jgi:hypothetical protein